MAVAAVLTGCQGTGSEPTTLSAPAPSAATTPPPPAAPPSSTPAASPAASSLSRDDAALATAVGYYEAVARAYRTLDVSEVKALSSPDCQGCAQQIAFLEEARDKGYRIEGGESQVLEHRILRGGDARAAHVRLKLRGSRMVVHDSGGRVLDNLPEVIVTHQVDLTRDAGQWRVSKIYELRE